MEPTNPASQNPVPPITPPQPLAQQPPQAPSPSKAKTLATILCLIFFFPLGLLFMWLWMKWSMWLKIVITAIPVVLIALLLPLLLVTLFAINPKQQFAQANDAKRLSDVRQLSNAIQTYQNQTGKLPAAITDTEKEISSSAANICADIMPDYMPVLPVDPKLDVPAGITSCSDYQTGYTIKTVNGQVVVSAPNAELDQVINSSN